MLSHLRSLLIGLPIPTQQEGIQRVNKIRGLAIFSPDALSSIAYANQEIYLGLIIAGSAGLSLSFPIGMAIVGLLIILTLSYFQTVHAYPTGGGSFLVATENLGEYPGLIAGAALLVDYLLTAAVSLTAGVAAIASAFPVLWPHRVLLALILLGVITWVNLRGLRDTGLIIALPVYGFLIPYLLMLAVGVYKAITNGFIPIPNVAPPEAVVPISLWLILHAFSTGCTALTGVEAISNGVGAFQPPESKNAGRTLIVMAALMGILFLGSIGLTQHLGVISNSQETILSALARKILGDGFAYYVIQFVTMGILIVAANTGFAGFPRVASILAKHGYMPRQFTALGDRLVFSTGILFLAVVCGVLIIVFNGDSHRLVPLFAVGAFLAFTLSQVGMVVHWQRIRGRGWRSKALMNGLGAGVTLITLGIVGVSKFIDGAWMTLILIPSIVFGFHKIKGHYQEVARELSMHGLPPDLKPAQALRIVIPFSSVHRGVVEAVNYARSISKDITGIYVELEPGTGEQVREKWERWFPDLQLAVVPSPYRSVIVPFLNYLDEVDIQHQDGQLAAVLLPEFIPAKWWQGFLHNQTAWLIKIALLYRRRRLGFQRMIIDIPIHLKK